MKKIILLPFLLLALAVNGQNEKRGIVLPGYGHVNTELLNKKIDLTLDVEQLNLNEVRILRNAFYARQGYPFKDAYLRGVFGSTSWYDSLMYVFDAESENFLNLGVAKKRIGAISTTATSIPRPSRPHLRSRPSSRSCRPAKRCCWHRTSPPPEATR